MFVVSDVAYKPDMYHTSFLVTKGENSISAENLVTSSESLTANYAYLTSVVVLVIIVAAITFLIIRKKDKGSEMSGI